MRIVMLLAKSTGGIGTHVDELTRELRALGHDVVLATDPLTARTFGWEAESVWPESPRGMPGATGSVRRLARGADVVHAHGHQAGALGALALRGLRRRERPALVVSLHNAVLGGPARQSLGTLAAMPYARTAQLVTGASSDLVDRARGWGAGWADLAPVPSPRVPGLLDEPVLAPSQRRPAARELLRSAGVECPDGADVVLTVARVAPQKDLPTLVRAAAAAVDADARPRVWAVLGGGDEHLARSLRSLAAHEGAPVHFLGAQADPAPWLRAAGVFVLTSHWEARALVVQEALAAGTPVVTRDAGGLRDLVEGVGTLVTDSDPQVWAHAVGGFLQDEDAWHTASAAGRQRAASWDDGRETAVRWVSWYARARAMT